VKYREGADRSKLEWQLLSKGTYGLRQQGMFVMAPSGQPLGYMNKGWPDPDPVAILAELRKAHASYQSMSRSARLLNAPLDPNRDKIRFEEDAFTKPPKTLDLRIVSRGLPYPGMTSFDQRHPMYFHIDRLWFKPSEWRAFLPRTLSVGAQTEVTGPARTRIVLLSHHQAGGSAWWEEHIRGGNTVSRITKVSGSQVFLSISANYTMSANSQWCKDRYQGDLLAEAIYDSAKGEFTRFDLAMLGTHTVGEYRSNLHSGDLTARIAVSATINPLLDEDDRMRPQNWKWGYTLNWCR
jgi:hypothetical protein